MRLFYILLSYFNVIFISFFYSFKKLRKIYPNHSLKHKLTISLTSKRSRFKFLHLTLKSIIFQTVMPDNLILWIDKKEKKFLNKNILNLKKYGLKIKYCKNFRSYNKIIHTLKINSKNYIITFDDDVIYEKTSVEYLVNKSIRNRNKIISNRIHRIVLNKSGMPTKYNKWNWNYTSLKAHKLNFLTGVYGVLYPPNSFFKDVTNEKIFLKLSPYADDLWLFWMIRLKKKLVLWSEFGLRNIHLNFDEGLSRINFKNNQNDKQIINLIKYYGLPK